jgi:hypothetical protein
MSFSSEEDSRSAFQSHVAAVGFEHAHEVAGVGDGGAEAFADWFVVGTVAEVVVAAGAGWFEHVLSCQRGLGQGVDDASRKILANVRHER